MKILSNSATYLFFCLLLFSEFSSAEINGYLCISEKATGFHYKNNEWAIANFNVKNSKYILTPIDGKWLWKELGESEQEKYPQFCATKNSGYINCEFMYRKVSFNSQTLRFQIYSPGSYVVHAELKKALENKKNSDAFLEIGTCTNL